MLDLAALGLSCTYTRRVVQIGLVREPSASWSRRRLKSASEVYEDLRGLALLDREAFIVLHLDQKNRIGGLHVVSIGSLSASLVHPREVFKAAMLSNAASVIVAHNHPSGDPTPSREDRAITTRLRQVGETLGIPVTDHVIIAAEGYSSAGEGGWL